MFLKSRSIRSEKKDVLRWICEQRSNSDFLKLVDRNMLLSEKIIRILYLYRKSLYLEDFIIISGTDVKYAEAIASVLIDIGSAQSNFRMIPSGMGHIFNFKSVNSLYQRYLPAPQT